MERRELFVGGRRVLLYAPTASEISKAVGGNSCGPGDAELCTWAVPWESGLFAQLSLWDLSAADVLDLGCGLGLAGVFAMLQGAKSVCFADRSHRAVELALLSAAENRGPEARCEVRGRQGCWAQAASAAPWPEVDLILGNEIVYVTEACGELTALLRSSVLRPGGMAVFSGCDRGLSDTFQTQLIAAGFIVQCGNGFAPGSDGATPHPTILLLVLKPEVGQEPSALSSLSSVFIRPEAWKDTGSTKAKFSPPPCVASSIMPPTPPTP